MTRYSQTMKENLMEVRGLLDENAFKKLQFAAKDLARLAAKDKKGMDYKDYMKAAAMMKTGKVKELEKFVMDLDTFPREVIVMKVADAMGKSAAERIFNVRINESFMSRRPGNQMADLYKLYNLAMKTMPGSPKQKEIEKRITMLRKELKLDEKLGKDADAGDYIDDFKKSDAPQFKGKSDKKKKDMAIAAYLDAKDKKEEVDEGMKYTHAAVDKKGLVIGFASDEKDAKDMARRNDGKVVKLKKPMSDKKGDMMVNRPFKEEVELDEDLEEATINLVNHDMSDPDFQKLIKKLRLKAKGSDDETTVTGNAKDIEKMLSTMYGNDWKDMFKQKGQKFVELEQVELDEDADKSLAKKSEASGISVGILKQVYKRGVAAWRTGHRPGTTPEQWGHARVNSFISGGKTRTTADKDLWAKHKGKSEGLEEGTVYIYREYEPGQYFEGDLKQLQTDIKKAGGKILDIEKPTRREPNLSIEADGDYNRIKRQIEKNDDGLTAVEEETINELKMNDPKLNKIFDKLKPKGTVKLKTSSSISKGTEFVDYVVKSKNKLKNGVEKITLATKDNPTSVKKFLYKRDGKVTFAIGDMGASIDDIKEEPEKKMDKPDSAKAVDQMRDDKKKTRIAQLQLQIAKATEMINKLNSQEKPDA